MWAPVGLVLVPLILATLAPGADGPSPPSTANPPPVVGRLLFAFNGTDLGGFSTFLRFEKTQDPAHVFSVINGCLRISGAEFGGITTQRSFENYHLIAEWRWGGATSPPRLWQARNSGILVHCTGAEGNGLGSWMAGLESQILEGGTGDLILVPGEHQPPLRLRAEVRIDADGQAYHRPGGTVVTRARGRLNWWGRDPSWRDVAWYRGAQDLDRPVGAWNRTDLVCSGDRVTCFLNGRRVNEAQVVGPASGRILLQSEGAEILFRKFEVRELIRREN